jgi:protein-S-isoprenylcysteine O-methyltransferase Ste14
VALTPIWLLIAYFLTELEEKELVNQYGDQYRDYQRRVPRLIPLIKWL